tara:strand:- start:11 stop:274 length:264 start_codon:yes stop_codon:yes gene_type:complete
MAFSATGWATIAASKRGSAPAIYSYTSADAKATVTGANYFNSLSDSLSVGDAIYHFDSNTPTATWSVVISNSGGTVDVSAGTAIGVT